MNILLVGNIASGKGTLAEGLEKNLNLKHISVGDIFRSLALQDTPMAKEVKSYMDKGELVPDSITVNLILNRLTQTDCKNGCILDGFPRNLAQAEALDKKLKLDKVLFIEVQDDTIIKRLTSRISCPNCKKIYNTSWFNGDTCECGTKLIQRADDLDTQAIKSRIASFEKNTMPVVNYYKQQNIVATLNGEIAPEEVLQEALEKLKV